MSQCFSVNRDDFSLSKLRKAPNPANKTVLKLLRINLRKDPTNGIMRWYTIRKGKKCFKPLVLFASILFYVGRTISSTDHGTNGNRENISQEMELRPFNPWVGEVTEIVD